MTFYEIYGRLPSEIQKEWPKPAFVTNFDIKIGLSFSEVYQVFDNAIWTINGTFVGLLKDSLEAVGDGVYSILSPTGEVIGQLVETTAGGVGNIIGSVGDSVSSSTKNLIMPLSIAAGGVVLIGGIYLLSKNKRSTSDSIDTQGGSKWES